MVFCGELIFFLLFFLFFGFFVLVLGVACWALVWCRSSWVLGFFFLYIYILVVLSLSELKIYAVLSRRGFNFWWIEIM